MNANRIFDAMMEASKKVHRDFEIKELNESVFKAEQECGGCEKWMTSLCPREKHHLVSCHELKCSEFSMQEATKTFIQNQKLKISLLKQQSDEITN